MSNLEHEFQRILQEQQRQREQERMAAARKAEEAKEATQRELLRRAAETQKAQQEKAEKRRLAAKIDDALQLQRTMEETQRLLNKHRTSPEEWQLLKVNETKQSTEEVTYGSGDEYGPGPSETFPVTTRYEGFRLIRQRKVPNGTTGLFGIQLRRKTVEDSIFIGRAYDNFDRYSLSATGRSGAGNVDLESKFDPLRLVVLNDDIYAAAIDLSRQEVLSHINLPQDSWWQEQRKRLHEAILTGCQRFMGK